MKLLDTVQESKYRYLFRIIVPLIAGLVVLGVTHLANLSASDIWSWTLSLLVAGSVLVVQSLAEFDHRIRHNLAVFDTRIQQNLTEVDSRISVLSEWNTVFSQVEGTKLGPELDQLARNVALLPASRTSLIDRFARHEMRRAATFFQDLGQGNEIVYDGEDQEWMLGLANMAESSIDAVSMSDVDGASGLWASTLGLQYLEVQGEALDRGVKIRRIFVITDHALEDLRPQEREVCVKQASLGIEVRLLDGRGDRDLFDFIVFDNETSYEVKAASNVGEPLTIVNTHVVLRPDRVRKRITKFDALWARALPFEPSKAGNGPPTQRTRSRPGQ